MINIMPPDVKENIVFARRNTLLRKWSFILLISMVVIIGVVVTGQIYLQQSINTYTSQVQSGQDELKKQKLDETQKEVQELTGSLKLATQVLQREILFSKLLSQIGGVLPSGTILTNLSIDKVTEGLDLQADAENYQKATQVQVNLADPQNKIFEKADIVSIQCTAPENASDSLKRQYPCTVQIRALFAKNNSFSFIKPGAGQ